MRKIILVLCLVALITGNAFAQKGYEKSIEIGTAIGVGDFKNNTFGISMINGYRINLFQIGVGIGFGYSNALNGIDIKDGITKEYRTDAYLIPVFLNLKCNLLKSKVSPFLRLDAGYTFDVNQYLKDAPGLMIEPAFGIDFKTGAKSAIYALVGFNLQHSKFSYTYNVGSIDDWDISTKSEMLKAISIRIGFAF